MAIEAHLNTAATMLKFLFYLFHYARTLSTLRFYTFYFIRAELQRSPSYRIFRSILSRLFPISSTDTLPPRPSVTRPFEAA